MLSQRYVGVSGFERPI